MDENLKNRQYLKKVEKLVKFIEIKLWSNLLSDIELKPDEDL